MQYSMQRKGCGLSPLQRARARVRPGGRTAAENRKSAVEFRMVNAPAVARRWRHLIVHYACDAHWVQARHTCNQRN